MIAGSCVASHSNGRCGPWSQSCCRKRNARCSPHIGSSGSCRTCAWSGRSGLQSDDRPGNCQRACDRKQGECPSGNAAGNAAGNAQRYADGYAAHGNAAHGNAAHGNAAHGAKTWNDGSGNAADGHGPQTRCHSWKPKTSAVIHCRFLCFFATRHYPSSRVCSYSLIECM